MKRRGIVVGIVTLLLIFGLSNTAMATTGKVQKELDYRDIKVSLNGSLLELRDAKGNVVEPFMFDGTNYVPARPLAEALGLAVSWDGQTSTINLSSTGTQQTPQPTNTGTTASTSTARKVQKEIEYRDIKVSLDGEILNLRDAKGNVIEPFMFDGTNYIPARPLAEALGLEVAWDGETNTIKLSSIKTYNVLRVIDGDTFVVDFNGTEETVRLIGVDTPESVHPDSSKNTDAGYAASLFTTAMLTDKLVGLEFDVQQRDQYGRLLAYAYLDGQMFNKKLLETGYANLATYPPNTKYTNDFTEIVKDRDSSIPSGKYIDGFMKAPTVIYSKPLNPGLALAFMYEEGKIEEKGVLTSEYDYLKLTNDKGSIVILVGDLQKEAADSLKVGDHVQIGFVYVGQADAATGVYAKTLQVFKETQASSPAPEEEDSNIKSRTVYVTKTGKRYHYSSSCNGGNYYPSTLSAAIARGLTPCNKCVN